MSPHIMCAYVFVTQKYKWKLIFFMNCIFPMPYGVTGNLGTKPTTSPDWNSANGAVSAISILLS